MMIFNRLKFKTQLYFSFTLIILFVIGIIMMMMHFILRASYRNQAGQILNAYGQQIAINIDNRMDYFISYLKLLATDKELLVSMERDDYKQVCSLLDNVTSEFINQHVGRVRDIRLYRSGIYGKVDGLDNIEKIFNEFIPGNAAYKGNFFITGTYLNNSNEKVFSIFHKVYQTNLEREYYLEMCIYETELFGFFNKYTDDNRIYILNGASIMSMNDRLLFGQMLYHNRDNNEFSVPKTSLNIPSSSIDISTGNSGFVVNIEATSEYLYRGYRLMLFRLVPVIIALLLISFAFVSLISMRFNHRLSTLQEKIATISSWELNKDLHIDGNDEFGILAGELDETRKRILNLIEQNNDTNELKRIAEMSALRAQINSHFLFNSLSTIKWLSKQGNSEELSAAVDSLALFLRYSLVLNENLVPLRKEIEQLEAYIYLQKLRYSDEINVHTDIEAELMNCKTVKLILQPLVENSIYHGRLENGNPLNITVFSYSEDGFYNLIVEDDGNGISQHVIDKILSGDENVSQSGYGLRNVIERIKMCSGGLGELAIESKSGISTKITIRQPISYIS